eukprot:361392-Chlamydomonas_euryale.AAC.1
MRSTAAAAALTRPQVCVPIDPAAAYDFDPETVCTVHRLLEQVANQNLPPGTVRATVTWLPACEPRPVCASAVPMSGAPSGGQSCDHVDRPTKTCDYARHWLPLTSLSLALTPLGLHSHARLPAPGYTGLATQPLNASQPIPASPSQPCIKQTN